MSCGGYTILGVLLLLLETCLYNICTCGMQGFRTTAVQTVRMRKADIYHREVGPKIRNISAHNSIKKKK